MLDGKRSTMMRKIERLAALSSPKVLLPEGTDLESAELAHDYQSIGAQGTNHVTNKLMLALFRPSAPFFKLGLDSDTAKQAAEAGVDEAQLAGILASAEMRAVKQLDVGQHRPKLYQALRHLVVAGNVLLDLTSGMRVMGLRYYCIKRDIQGTMKTLVIRESVPFEELEDKVKESLPNKYTEESQVAYYKLIQKVGDEYKMTCWVDTVRLPSEFDSKWSLDKCPYLALTWDLADEANYGTGLVEEYVGDLEAVSALSESVVTGAVQASEYRWMVDPTGMTTVDDFNRSKNGDALPGRGEDVQAVNSGNDKAISVSSEVAGTYEQRISRGFLLGSSVTRNAERVTAEEVRLTANELEIAYGGVYSTLAASLQLPIAKWLLKSSDLDIAGTKLEISIVTGLGAISRGGDLENLRLALADLAQIAQFPPVLQARMKWTPIIAYVGQGRGIDLTPFFMTDTEFNAMQEKGMQDRVQESTMTAAGETAATGAA